MGESPGEKKHLPSAHRLLELKKKGTVLRSKDLSVALSILIITLIFSSGGSIYYIVLQHNFLSIPVLIQSMISDRETLSTVVFHMFSQNIFLITFVPLSTFFVALITPFIFGGWNFTIEPLGLKFERLSPADNLKKIFSPVRAGKELLKSLIKTIVVISSGLICLFVHRGQITSMLFQSSQVSAVSLSAIIIQFLGVSIAVSFVFSIVDIFMAQNEFMSQHRMTSKEVEDENKESDGSPETKRRIRTVRLSMMRQRIAIAVPKADVIVTNPTHYAVALRYRSGKDVAPVLLVKGREDLAAEIRRIAVRCNIPIYSAPAVARAIYHTVKVGKQIQPELYMSVAIILSWLRQLEEWQSGKGPLPKMVSDFDLPEKFRFKD